MILNLFSQISAFDVLNLSGALEEFSSALLFLGLDIEVCFGSRL